MRSLDEFACEKLAALEHAGCAARRWSRREGIYVERNGRRLISFSCNDYLNLSQHPAVIEAAVEATKRYGIGAGASRLVTGNHPLYAELESAAGAAEGDRRGLRVRLRLSRQYRNYSGTRGIRTT